MQRSLPVFVSEHLLQVDDRRREFTDNQTHSGTGPGHGHSFLIQLSSLLFSSLLFSSLSLSLSLSSINTKEDAPNKRRFSASAMVSGELWLSFVLVFAACAMVLASHLATSLQVAHRLLLLLTLNFDSVASRPGCLESWANAGIGASSLSEASHSLCARLCSSESCSEASCCTNN